MDLPQRDRLSFASVYEIAITPCTWFLQPFWFCFLIISLDLC